MNLAHYRCTADCAAAHEHAREWTRLHLTVDGETVVDFPRDNGAKFEFRASKSMSGLTASEWLEARIIGDEILTLPDHVGETHMTDLADWLLEQIAEDEADARWLHDVSVDNMPTLEKFGDCICGRPARVLAECESKRRIIAEHHKVEEYADPITFCSACGGHPSHGSDWPCYTLRLLALPYADRPGFREEWRPQ